MAAESALTGMFSCATGVGRSGLAGPTSGRIGRRPRAAGGSPGGRIEQAAIAQATSHRTTFTLSTRYERTTGMVDLSPESSGCYRRRNPSARGNARVAIRAHNSVAVMKLDEIGEATAGNVERRTVVW